MRSRSYCTLSNCRRAVLAVWVAAALLTAPVFLTQGTERVIYTNLVTNITIYHCNKTGLIFAVYQFVILFGAPGILMIICYSFVIRELWRSTRNLLGWENFSFAAKPKFSEAN
ncbi:Class A rhodopsin-like G-protein coupled receptor GPRnna14, putative [Gryllus bimaculatus]|nr:Class A rhodopsin-like G-protein coupled receptor GPRnna14, putative [Gryllus bimaculatus]